jgi:tetratricopeptide (TPR) repeat protein
LWINIGYTRYKTNDFTGAEAAYQKSLQLAPNYSQPHRYLGRFLLKNNQIEKAFDHLGKAAEYDSKIYPELLHLARKQFPDDGTEIEKAVKSNDVKSQKILAGYLIKHHLLTERTKAFLIGEDLNDKEKNEFISYLIKKEDFQTAYHIWTSLGSHKGKFENQEKNMIFDGGFEHLVENEEVGFGWQIIPRNDSLAVVIDDQIYNSGKQALKIKFDGQTRAKTNVISQMILVKPNRSYRLTFAVKSSELITGGLPFIVITDAQSKKDIAQSKVINSTNDKWIQQIVDFRTNETPLITVNLQRMGCDVKLCPIMGLVWLDDFVLRELGK